jgi:branched-chain amino acid transport system permease protein
MPFITHTDPFDAFDIGRSVSSLVFPIFGGLYTSAGPVIGTIVMRSLEEYLRVTPPWKDGYQVVYGLVIVVAVLFMPRGVLGLAQRYSGRLPWRFSR